MKFEYKRALKTCLWGITGLVISISILAKDKTSLFGYPLYILSLLMFVLAIWQFYKDNKSKNKK